MAPKLDTIVSAQTLMRAVDIASIITASILLLPPSAVPGLRSRSETELSPLLTPYLLHSRTGAGADIKSDTDGLSTEKPSYVEVVFKMVSL